MSRKAKDAPSSSEDRFRTIFELAPEAYYLNDLNGTFIDGNRVAEEITGYSREELVGQNFLSINLLHESSLQKAAEHLARNAKGHPSGPDTFTLNRKDGRQVEVEIRAHPVTIGGENLVLGIARDVTERSKLERELRKAHRQLEERVRERTAELAHTIELLETEIEERKRTEEEHRVSEERYRSVIEQSADCIFIVDIETRRVLDANRAFREKIGYTAEEMKDLELNDFIAHEPEDVDEKVREVTRSGSLFIEERQYRHKDGTIIPMEVSVSVISTRERKVFCVVSRDITERTRAEEEKARIHEQLLQAQKMEAIGLFAGGVAHDFNNMMTAILGRAQLANLKLEDSHPAGDDLSEIVSAAESAADLSRQLLLFSRQQPTQKKPLNVLTVIENMKRMLSRLMGEDVRVSVEGPRDTWTVEADKGNIEQLIMNLAGNARDAMPKGGSLAIHVWNINLRQDSPIAKRTGRTGKFVRISVADDGTGMDPDALDHIFEPFYTTKSEAKGTGLGLSVVSGIVEQHGGFIYVDSEPGEGTDFRIYLPAAPDLELEEETGEWSLERYTGNGEKILIVEDDDGVRDFAAKTLRFGGYVVEEAATAQEAIAILEKEGSGFDLVFSDIVMPGMSGIDLVEVLSERWPDLRVVLTSGYTEQKAQLETFLGEGYPFLSKPYDVPSLLKRLKKSLGAR
jgi:PAS domain S-box-containing protein